MPSSESTPLLGSVRSFSARQRNFFIAGLAIATGCLVGLFLLYQSGGVGAPDREIKRVPLEAHIMSKCPDARDCLRDLIVPSLIQVGDKVDFRISYIGKLDRNQDYGVDCKHGAPECLGNMIGLCAAERYPDPKIYVGFMTCMTAKYDQIPEGKAVHQCALEHGISMEEINDCVSSDLGAHSTALLQASVNRSLEANVYTSCTVRLNEQVRCVRDGGKWKSCSEGSSVSSLVRNIDKLYSTLNRGW